MAFQAVPRMFFEFRASTLRQVALARCMSAATASATADVRAQLMTELKSAMKSKDTFRSTTIRSVLAEVQNADKARPEPLASSGVVAIIRKATTRRTDAAAEFAKADRPDLAEKEKREAELLESFLPALLSKADIDRVLHEVIAEQKPQPGENAKKVQGLLMKAFYSKVDRTLVDTDLVKARAEAALSKLQATS